MSIYGPPAVALLLLAVLAAARGHAKTAAILGLMLGAFLGFAQHQVCHRMGGHWECPGGDK